MRDFTDKQKVQAGKYLEGDEVEYHRLGNKNWFVDVIDTTTRYVVSSNYVEDRELPNMKRVYDVAKSRTGNAVEVISTDGLFVYKRVLKKTFGLRMAKGGKTASTSKIKHNIVYSDSGRFNYKIERFHNTLRERTKIMRGFHGCFNSASLIMKGFEIYYNWIREHSNLNTTPSDIAIPNFQFKDDNRWLELINLGYSA